MPIAVQEHMLSGATLREKFNHALALGVAGIEFSAVGLTERVPEIVDCILATGVRAAAVDHSHAASMGDLLAPDPAERERALANLRQSIANAVDIAASGVIFVPHFGAPVLPDLSPWMSSAELEAEMLHMHLRTLSDFSEALGVDLYILPVERTGTHLLNRLEQAARVTRRLNHHRVKIAADLYHMSREEQDVHAALHEQAEWLGHIRLADANYALLPGEGTTDFAAIARTLHDSGYDGWLTCACIGASPDTYRDRLPASLAALRAAGIS